MYVSLDPLFVKRSIRETRSSSRYAVGREAQRVTRLGESQAHPHPGQNTLKLWLTVRREERNE